MVSVFGDNIIGCYTRGKQVLAIYNNGVKVWPSGPDYYYISWTPTTASGSFHIGGTYDMAIPGWVGGSSYRLEDYNGFFSNYSGIITDYAFAWCSEIESIETNAYSLSQDAFLSCDSLSYASLSNCRYVGFAAFCYCYSLRSVYLPNCVTVDRYAFIDCYDLNYISLPVCTYVGASAFWDCNLNSIDLPQCSYIGSYAFNDCSYLNNIDLPQCSYIGSGAFYKCSNLVNITLGYSSVCVLSESNAFWQCSILRFIYVPSSLVSAYVSDSVWSYYSSMIFSIGGYTPPSVETLDFSNLGLSDRTDVDCTQGTYRHFSGYNFTLRFDGGTTNATYYSAGGGAVRIYGGGSVTIESDDYISSVEYTWLSTYKPAEDVATPSGYDTTTNTWTGNSKTVVLTRPSGSGNWRLHSVTINYA